ncbi:O-methyltransferase [Tetragenococcus halophilus]|uniref:tRNA 5-hydroxyuridine methyltransferase n=3 Tax=Tetragenococcus halophilus TaxID=51669 RepID=A0A2H6C865_TETHA|nr:O-methyltransferase [Tetragenococcus halophilus]MCF1601338.1 O-methyltransferase [Tetragenococcus halophilus]MCF1674744.1 O-methyltransferase [Tetragenococcus halophilus]MCO8286738.1 O-methyltransferase [Tetragenococcus halophilus]MCO8288021.1 O-methyltransferase [Tetragenococcus halophilus]MCO8290122.1 O-methyltransferase [Tetragenococcus halophilus]
MQNEMMHRPVVKAELVDYMRSQQKSLTGKLNIIEKDANKRGVPIIPHETVVFMEFLLGQIKPQQVLEIGTAIGFSASLMAQYVGDKGHVTTIDRFDKMIAEAKETFRFLELEDKITLLEGQAADILPTLKGSYDFIFMDSAKSKYIEFLPDCLRLLKKEGVLMVDDVFQGGTILQDEKEIPRGKRGIHKKLNQFLDTVNQHPDLASSLLPLGDGVMLITKKADEVVL